VSTTRASKHYNYFRDYDPSIGRYTDGVWTVRGTIPADFHGGTPMATVRQADGLASVTSETR